MADGTPLPPELSAPLAGFEGAVPPAPAWFQAAVARAPERTRIAVEGAGIEMLTWGDVGKPGLLFLHGNGAHADWWSYIAPFFADDYRVAAISWSGMGGSDWRDGYDIRQFVREAFAAVEAAGLDVAGKPIFVGHSFGGFPTLIAAAEQGERLRAAITVDSPVMPPGRDWNGPPQRQHRLYATLPEALARFRLAPPQPCENLFIADHIARRSLKETPQGWTWRFDPFLWTNFRRQNESPALASPTCPIALMWGDRSNLIGPETADYMRSLAPEGTPIVVIPDADHHVLIDQPLALVAALRALFETWPG